MKKLLIAFLFPLMAFGQGTPTLRFDTVADMVAKSIPTVNNSLTALVTGRVTANDGGGGTFYFTAASVTATNLGTVFPSTGVAGRWFREYSGPLNVRWFGAAGDGVADDYLEITNAIGVAFAASLTAKPSVFLPAGNYNVSSMISVLTSNLVFRGDGVATTRLQYTGASTVDAVMKVSGTGLYGLEFSDLTFSGTALTSAALHLNAAHHSSFRNLRVRNAPVGLFVNFAVASAFENISCSSNEGAFTVVPVNGVILTNSVNACRFESLVIEGVSGDGLIIDAISTDSVIHAGTIENNGGWGLRLKGSSANYKLDSIYFELNTGGDVIIEASASKNTFVGGIGGDDLSIAGDNNTFIGGQYDGITIDATGAGNTFLNVTYAGNGGAFVNNGSFTTKLSVLNISTATFDRNEFGIYQVNQSTAIADPTTSSQYAWLLNRGTTNKFGIGADNTLTYLRSFTSSGLDIFSTASIAMRAASTGDVLIRGGDAGSGSSIVRFIGGDNVEKASFRGDGLLNAPNITLTGLGAITSGTYLPTLNNVANLDGSTAFTCQYSRVGNVVTVSGKVLVNPTTTLTLTQLGISLPVASALTQQEQCSGTSSASGIASQSAAIRGDAANDRAEMAWIATDVTDQPMYFSFTYLVQ